MTVHDEVVSEAGGNGHEREPPEEPEATNAPASVRPSPSAWIGRVIDDRYRVVSLLGEGGMGAVYAAEHLKLGKGVALKVIHPEFANVSAIRERFQREVDTSARFEHPHVASSLDCGLLPEGGAYLIMQLVRGKSLRQMLDEHKRASWVKACEVGAQVADALCAAHAAGVVHRDLKPDNVMLELRDDDTEFVKVLDFGIARILDDEGSVPSTKVQMLTRVGTILGTPGYMAPEQALGQPADHRADIYALGVMLWEMIAGQRLFDAPEVTQILTKQLTTSPEPLRNFAANVPVALDELIVSMLAQSPEHRPNRASEVRDTLRAFAFASKMPSFMEGALGRPAPGSPVVERSTYARPAPLTSLLPPTLRNKPAKFWMTVAISGLVLSFAVALVALKSIGTNDDVRVSPLPPAPTPTSPTPSPTRALQTAVPKRVRSDIDRHVSTVAESSDRNERRLSAKWLVAFQPESHIPEYARVVAQLELARGCSSKRKAIVRLKELGDSRALSAIERAAKLPRKGCGFLGLSDCFSCLRSEVAGAEEALRPAKR